VLEEELGVVVLVEDCEFVDCVSVPVADCVLVPVEVDCAAATDATASSAASVAILNCVIKVSVRVGKEPGLKCAAPRVGSSGYLLLHP